MFELIVCFVVFVCWGDFGISCGLLFCCAVVLCFVWGGLLGFVGVFLVWLFKFVDLDWIGFAWVLAIMDCYWGLSLGWYLFAGLVWFVVYC